MTTELQYLVVDWPAVRERCAAQRWQAAYAAAGLSRNHPAYLKAAAYIEERKAEALQRLIDEWRNR